MILVPTGLIYLTVHVQSSSTTRSINGRRSRAPATDNIVASAVRRLNLERDDADSDSTLAGPTTRLQWCQQWLHHESAKRRSSEPNTSVSELRLFALKRN